MKLIGKGDLDTPALCLDVLALERNIERMASFFAPTPATLRPHTKTHKCPTIAWMQLRAGAVGVTCAKLGEAEVMAQAGIRDILIANQIVGGDKIRRLVSLAAECEVMVAVDSADNATMLAEAARAKGTSLRTLIEVNVGMGRCGVEPGEPALELARVVTNLDGLRFEGLMGYEGHAVMIPDLEERRQMAEAAMSLLIATRDLLQDNGIPVGIVSGGGTGTYMITGAYPGVTEVQAGSYATMDAKYRSVQGVDFEPALTVLARVISVNAQGKAIVDAGMKAVTVEFGLPELLYPQGWRVEHLSEEHGTLARVDGERLRPGDLIEMIPSHGCTTINLHEAYHVLREDIFEGLWPISARGAVR